jgi:mannose-6-phosphate isomerase-like protein (cupin superfamily)
MIKSDIKIGVKDAVEILSYKHKEFVEIFKRKSLNIELYKPDKVDRQQPHSRDEIYVIISGSGMFFCDGLTIDFIQGDVLFVPAGAKHRFENFTNDFMTWVFFYGPEGGE